MVTYIENIACGCPPTAVSPPLHEGLSFIEFGRHPLPHEGLPSSKAPREDKLHSLSETVDDGV